MSAASESEIKQESDRLRQIARSHAAGDISRDDYREIRTAMIDAFSGEDDDLATDDAVTEMMSGPAASPHGGSDVDAVFEGESPWTLLAIVAGGSALLAAVIVAYFYLV